MGVSLAIGLFVTICTDGAAHELPGPPCMDLQIGQYATVQACNNARPAAVNSWLTNLSTVLVIGSSCRTLGDVSLGVPSSYGYDGGAV